MVEQLGCRRELLGQWPTPEEWGQQLAPGAGVSAPIPMFPRIDKDVAAALIAKWAPPAAAEAPDAAPASAAAPAATAATAGPAAAAAGPLPEIDIEEFRRLELRIATVLSAEPIPKADKLLKLTVDIGRETRQVVAGIATAYAPRSWWAGRSSCSCNLKPAKIRGILSSGMILAAGEEAVIALAAVDRAVPPGTKVR